MRKRIKHVGSVLKKEIVKERGCSSDGRAFASHARGKGIDTPHLHYSFNKKLYFLRNIIFTSFSYTYKKIKNNKLKNKEGIIKYSLSIIYRIKKNDKLVK